MAGLCAACLLTTALSDTPVLGVSESSVAILAPGTTLGPFRIVRPLGRGGMAAVYEARDTRLDRAVALKVLPPEFLHDETFGRRFEEEARLVAKLEHVNIVPIYAGGIDGGIPWMSMRLMPGGTLAALLEQRRPEPREAVNILRQIAAALDYAHAHGIVHRDVKPANVLLDRDGRLSVADFGLAQMLGVGPSLTQTGMLTGTPHYMAPEQALGGPVDSRCDIYSLGIVAYEMFVGKVPFAASTPVAVLLQHVNEPLPLPPGGVAESPWMTAILRAAAKRPEDRWQSAGAFAEALEASLAAPAGVSDERHPGRMSARAARSWKTWATATVGALFAAGALVWFGLPVRPHDPEAPSVPHMEVRTDVNLRTENSPAPASVRPRSKSPAQDRPSRPQPQNANGGNQQIVVPPADAAPVSPNPASAAPPPAPAATPPPESPPPEVAKPSTTALATPAAPAADVVVAPVCVGTAPIYPDAARAAQLEGDVLLEVLVGVDGRVGGVRILSSDHRLFDQAAHKAVLEYQCSPGRRNGVPESARIQIPVKFRIERDQ